MRKSGHARLERGQDRRQDDERGASCARRPPDHRPPKRGAFGRRFPGRAPSAPIPASIANWSSGSDADGSVRLYCCLPWFRGPRPAALAKVTSRMAFATATPIAMMRP